MQSCLLALALLCAARHFTSAAAAKAAAAPKPNRCAPRCDVTKCPSPVCSGGYVPDRCDCCLVCVLGDGDTCGRKNDPPCGQGLECKTGGGGTGGGAGRRRASRGVCRCKTAHRVCGSDGRSYGDVCKLRTASRKAVQRGLAAVTQVNKGPCLPPSDTGHAALHPNSARYRFNFIADVVEKIAPAVVHIELFLQHPLYGRHVPLSSGSGFVMTPAGLIVTNAHVVTPAAAVTGRPQVRVRLHDGDAYEATVRDLDRKSDIATIKVNSKKKLPVLSLGRSADLRPGEFVVAIGSPFALQNTVTTGIVSTTQRDGKELGIRDSDMDYIQTDAIINDGEVIGINTLKVTAGISFAIPADRINRFLTESQTKNKEKARLQRALYQQTNEAQSDTDAKRRVLGIQMLTLTEALTAELKFSKPDFPDISGGVLVHQVIPGSAADMSGIRTGDVIVQLNGQPLLNTDGLHAALLGDKPLVLEVLRASDKLLFNIQPQLILH
ncbi:Serine protease HTRA3 [Merluccius polli]|uniref:Serine protease HTRA2, mitochondrial n=1 Tax=Merluccius polli TaxID=89951 RepID=A0AA47MSI0_MERPO|nr:Serine protease HTRA3 [Merluccius polli]